MPARPALLPACPGRFFPGFIGVTGYCLLAYWENLLPYILVTRR